jgi:predicted Zn-dependent peptidase
MTPLFLQEELERERPVVTAEFDRAESNPYFQLNREVERKLWYKYYSRKNVMGDRDTILTAGQDKMRTIQKRYYPMIMAMNILRWRIFEEVRTKRNLSYAPAVYFSNDYANRAAIYVSTVKPDTTIKVMFAEIKKIQDKFVENLRNVTIDDVKRVANLCIHNIQFAVLGNPDLIDKQLFTSM